MIWKCRKWKRTGVAEEVTIRMEPEEVRELVLRIFDDLEAVGVVKRRGDEVAMNLAAIAAAAARGIDVSISARTYHRLKKEPTFNAAASLITLGFIVMLEEAFNMPMKDPDPKYLLGLWLASASMLRLMREDSEGRKVYDRILLLTKALQHMD
ncbi:MAG: hypothetical protein QW794_00075 [Thermosphaera sp.]